MTQAAASCSYAISPASLNLAAAGGLYTVAMTATAGCGWTATSQASWIGVTSSGGTGNGTLAVNVAANPGIVARTGTVTIGGKTLTVSQSGVACSYTVNTTSVSMNRKAGSASVNVTAPTGCGWTVAEASTWITPALLVGTGTAPATLQLSANTTGVSRTATVTIAGRSVTVTQLGRERTQALDFDGNGAGDLLLYKGDTGAWSSRLNVGGFRDAAGGTWSRAWTIQPADFDGDERSDLLLYNAEDGRWFKALSLGNGSFQYVTGPVWQTGYRPTVLDFNGDGKSDVLLYAPANGRWVQAISGAPTADFTYPRSGVWSPGWLALRMRLNADTRDDLFLYNPQGASDPNSGRWFRVLTNSDLSFGYLEGPVRWSPGWSLTEGDFTGDGLSELFLYGPDGRTFVVSFGTSGATYRSGQGGAGWTVKRAMLDADTKADLFFYNRTTGAYVIGRSVGDGTFVSTSGTWAAGWQVEVTDVNLDGISDFTLYNATTGQYSEAVTGSSGFTHITGEFGAGWCLVGSHQSK